MSVETVREMENRWHLMMAATDPKTGRRVAESDLRYAADCHKLRVEIEDRKAAETARPQISPTQLDQLAWLDRLQAARYTGDDGKVLGRVVDDPTPKGSKFRQNVELARQRIYAGGTLTSEQIAATEASIGSQKVAVPEPSAPRVLSEREMRLAAEGSAGPGTNMPPPSHYHTAALLQRTGV